MTVTGERVVTSEGGFNPTWQRHVAAYALCAQFLGRGKVLDLGCGVGHSFELLAPRETVGMDLDPGALEGQARETVVGDMRQIPFADGSFESVLSVHSIEHVPDPERALEAVARVLQPGGTAVFVTPNRLTFARADEIIDPYHYVEYDPAQLRTLAAAHFPRVEIHGIFGSPRMLQWLAVQKDRLDATLRLDPLRVRRLVPRRIRQRLYDRRLTAERKRRGADPGSDITPGDFSLASDGLEAALDLVAVCHAAPPG